MDLSKYPELMTGKQVAEAFGISRWTLQDWRRKPGFPAPVQTPGRPRWRKVDVRRYHDRLSVEGEPKLRRAV